MAFRHHGERRWHTAVPLFLVASFFMLAIVSGHKMWITVVALTVVGAGLTAYLPTFWTMSTGLLSDSAAAASIGLINSVGNLGGFVGPFVMGYLSTRTGSFTSGLIFLLAGAFLSGVLVISLKDRRGGH